MISHSEANLDLTDLGCRTIVRLTIIGPQTKTTGRQRRAVGDGCLTSGITFFYTSKSTFLVSEHADHIIVVCVMMNFD